MCFCVFTTSYDVTENKRKRIKLECLNCGSIFNNDYRAKHERQRHDGKRIKVKHFGAPKNPFEASKSSYKECSPTVSTYLLPFYNF